jgi:hypothetical protein
MNYLDKLKHLNQRSDTAPAIQTGSFITWTRGDGSIQTGLVDYLHLDADRTTWAFVTIEESWSAVNLKFATVQPAP